MKTHSAPLVAGEWKSGLHACPQDGPAAQAGRKLSNQNVRALLPPPNGFSRSENGSSISTEVGWSHIWPPNTPASLLPRTPRRKECMGPQEDTYRITYSSFLYNSQKVGTTKMSVHKRMDTCGYSNTGKLCSHNKGVNYRCTQQPGWISQTYTEQKGRQMQASARCTTLMTGGSWAGKTHPWRQNRDSGHLWKRVGGHSLGKETGELPGMVKMFHILTLI